MTSVYELSDMHDRLRPWPTAAVPQDIASALDLFIDIIIIINVVIIITIINK